MRLEHEAWKRKCWKNENYTLFGARSIDYCEAGVSRRRIASTAFPSKATPTSSEGSNENRI